MSQADADAQLVAGAAAGEVRHLADRADTADIDAWWDSTGPEVEATTRRGFGAAAGLMAQGIAADALLNGLQVDPVSVALNAVQLANALRVTGPVAFKTNMRLHGDADQARLVMAERLERSVQRLSMAGARETLTATAAANPDAMVGYRRVLRGPENCAFCRMLAGRGAVYRSESSGGRVVGRATTGRARGRTLGEKFHDGCDCGLEAVWGTPEQRRAAVADDPTVEFDLAAAPLAVGAGNLRLVRPGKSGWHHIVDEQGNIVEKVNGKAKAEARLAELSGGTTPPAAGHTFRHKGGGQYEIFDSGGNKVGQVKGRPAAEARIAELDSAAGTAPPTVTGGGAHTFRHKGGGHYEIVDPDGNVVGTVRGKAAAEARAAELSGGTGSGGGAHTIRRTGPRSAWYEVLDSDGNVVEKVQGKAKAEARAKALSGDDPTAPVVAAREKFDEIAVPADLSKADADGNTVPTAAVEKREAARLQVGTEADDLVNARLRERDVLLPAEAAEAAEKAKTAANEAYKAWINGPKSGKRHDRLRDAYGAAYEAERKANNAVYRARREYAGAWREEVRGLLDRLGVERGGVPARDLVENWSSLPADQQAAISEALGTYPKHWLERSTGRDAFDVVDVGNDRASMRSAAMSRTGRAEMNLSGSETDVEIIVHEFGHHMENLSEDLRAAEWAWYWRRTEGEPLQSLQSLFPGSKYTAGEMSRPDEWATPYMGKPYVDMAGGGVGAEAAPRSSYELWTMAAQAFLPPNPASVYTAKAYEDTDMRRWFLSVLLTA